MSDSSKYRMRRHALATATALALSAIAVPALAQQAQINTTGLESGEQYQRFIVKYRDGSDSFANAAVRGKSLQMAAARSSSASRGSRGLKLALGHLRRIATGADVVRSSRKLDKVQAAALMRQIAANPDVLYVEVDRLMHPIMTPNDTYYSQYQWHYYEAAGGIKADQAWDTADGSGVVVAVIDTGITDHSDLNANIVAGYDFISDASIAGDGNGRDSDPHDAGDFQAGGSSSWHGTHVSGTIAAITDNGKGVAGVAHGAKVSPIRVLGKGGGYTSDIVDGIVWAAGGSVSGVPSNPNPAEVINMSLGGGGSCSSTYQNAIDFAVSQGTTVVVAAGNSNDATAGYTPASCDNVIAVASTTRTGARSSFSNYGSLIDVAAPGSDIASTVNSGSTTPSTEGYSLMSGTSMASPHVAGVVALMQSAASTPLTPAQVEQVLKDTLRPFPVSIDRDIGNGIVDSAAAVAAVIGNPPPPPPPGGNELQDGVAVSGIAGGSGSEQFWTMVVPAGASNLSFQMSGGSGDADMYVNFGSQPTTSSWDCRPYEYGNNEVCTIAAPQAGTYHVMIRGYQSFSGTSLVGSYDAGGGGGQTFFENSGNYNINDKQTTESPISVSRSGNAPSSLSVDVNIVHTYRGDLIVDLVAPDGSTYNLHNGTGGGANNINGTYTVNASSESANGTWKLRVYDRYNGDNGYINSWSLQF